MKKILESQILERPGYLGKKRSEVETLWDQQYGKDAWEIAYQLGDFVISREFAISLYEDGYYHYFITHPLILDMLVRYAKDIYDTAESNIESELDYSIQETPNNHIHDISIRRAVYRLGFSFRGDRLIQIRGKGTEGEKFSPHMIPFHLPSFIYQEEIKDYSQKGKWWNELGIDGSIEAFYQQNKILVVKP